jgi:hypothetical protein
VLATIVARNTTLAQFEREVGLPKRMAGQWANGYAMPSKWNEAIDAWVAGC